MENNIEQDKLPDALPVLPLIDVVAYPLAIMPLTISRQSSVKLIDEVMRHDRKLALVTQKDVKKGLAKPEDLYQVGSAAIILQLTREKDGNLRMVAQGIERIKIIDYTSTDPFLIARIEPRPDKSQKTIETDALRQAIFELLRKLVGLIEGLTLDLVAATENLSNAYQMIYLIAVSIPFSVSERQEILELDPLDAKLRRLVELLQHEVTVRELGHKITNETQERLSKAQHDYYLREQVRSIQKELGEGPEQSDVADLRKKLNEAGLTEEAKREADRELERLSTLTPAAPEYGIIRSYLDWLANLPWNKVTGVEIDLQNAERILDEDHYDLSKIKDRILEYLAVKKLRKERENETNNVEKNNIEDADTHEPILCFVGPPGVGKTSLGQSIARALGRKFVRISLGGLHDEAEIRGHRRTYIGAMPGRIIQSVKRAEARDAVFMLDEIDKVGADWRGDPSSALLEVLDPAQNQTFVDNYLGVAFDLSQILFITTANNLDTIPPPLLDRMEVLRLPGYTDDEKVQIAKRYLIPKQITANGLKENELEIETKALLSIIRGYTREAGVRNLDREIAKICRKIARDIASENKQLPEIVTSENLTNYVGKPIFFDEATERTNRPGIAIGMAWTPTGGDVLFIEATMMPSKKEGLILTGMLGDVMRESVQAALSFVRSNAESINIDPNIFRNKTLHVHVPAGAIPKDGPSAGVTMLTAIASLATGRLVRHDLAMTGEITLRGKILPVGGIKEKVLAAHRAGIKNIILPHRNQNDLDDIAPELRNDLTIILVNTAEEVLQNALV